MSEPMVEVQGLVKHYGKVEALKGIDFAIDKGEIFGLIGPNGAGKTTTVNILSAYVRPTDGKALVNGKDVTSSPYEIKVLLGVVPQEIAIYPTLSAEENLRFFGRIYGLSKESLSDRVDYLLELAGLQERRKESAQRFSGGMKRRLNLVIGLLNQPRLLLLDEPTLGVDPQSREHIFDTIFKLKDKGTTILYTTHYLEEVEKLCDHIAIIDEGKIIAQGTLEELLSLRKEAIQVEKPRGLEQVFIQLTGKRLRD